MRLKHLQSALSSVPVKQFPNPKITLEQYATSAELASHVIHYALSNGDIGESCSVLDLGCGTGMLSIGCAIVGTKSITCVDCDEEAIQIAKENVEAMGLEEVDSDDTDDDELGGKNNVMIEFVLAEVKHTPKPTAGDSSKGRGGKGGRGRGRGKSRGRGKGRGETMPRSIENMSLSNDNGDDDGLPIASNCVDTVLTNPPFGTKHNAGIDLTFLRTAIRLATKAVYSFHKSSTSRYLIKAVESWGYEVEVVAQMKFEIPKMYKFHKQNEVDVEVDLIRVNVVSKSP